MAILVLNAGSSSPKFGVVDPDADRDWLGGTVDHAPSAAEIESAVRRIAARLAAQPAVPAIDAVAHRIVHGGAAFTRPVRVTPDVREALGQLAELAPLHNPPGLRVIDAARAVWPDVPHIAVFDTAFHATMPPEAFTYPLPFQWTERWQLRRFGFHGASNAYCARRASQMLQRPANTLRLVVAHLGNGASVTAIDRGHSADTSMGFTPLEGLMMGTRSGSIDPGLLLYLQTRCGVSIEALEHALNQESGLLGVSGVSSDMRAVLDSALAGHGRAGLAVRIFVHRARQAIGAMAVTLGEVDALVFTGGIGEHSAEVRGAICDGLALLGLDLDERVNQSARPDAIVSTESSHGRILVIATREDLEIARAATRLLG